MKSLKKMSGELLLILGAVMFIYTVVLVVGVTAHENSHRSSSSHNNN